MASAMRKMAVYLGLVEDDHRYQEQYDSYEEYDEYGEQGDELESADGPEAREPDVGVGQEMVHPGGDRPRPSSPRPPTWPGSPHCIRVRTMRLVLSESTSARALR